MASGNENKNRSGQGKPKSAQSKNTTLTQTSDYQLVKTSGSSKKASERTRTVDLLGVNQML